ncbi:bifunctional uroporphyrinogen-III C-methyltransferase/uroporphyrinogen-III synthase [Phycicoccus sp. BSK3Z-2]|uniref:Bifunctional uroporphyrinogen-III C-methyltransferase/uroporphyrinogen-III synthase n=1 Tax=Phycicoccus avicenniae TaxID=2828860 RepID=A0A941HYS8_9MICO|nr:bifunctional uroporphyrinogen-III C-methyltransferase/uroporphyrinogen-III synthase [Phycicoccus avicenniae]MBR7743303.1 bifunctional uroporphyrinogen-III C-methyltransferase/uroporphyrinogen-III synthase [Phycicoccus avicenniae]
MSPTRSTTRPPRVPARVAFVGGGPGDPDLLTLRASRLLAAADAVVVDQVARDDLALRHAPAAVDIVDAGHGDQGERLTQASRAKLVVRTAKAHPGGLVVRLMDGDPAVFNGFAEEAQALVKAGVAFEVVPGVSSVTAVPSYAGVPLTAKTSSSVHVVVAGGASPDVAGGLDPATTVVVLGAPDKAADTLRALAAAGRDAATPVAVTERGTTTSQRTVVTTLAEAPEAMAAGQHPVLAVVGDTVVMRDALSWFETKPLFGWSVLVPRTKEQSGTMTTRLEHHGARAEIVPTISVEPPRTPQQLERAVKGMVTGRYEWIGFTSVNAVRAIREKFDEFGLDARSFAGLKVAAVGGVTAEALREWGINPDLVPTDEQSAKGLLEAWPPYDADLDPIDRVFLPRADIATDTLVAGLQDTGWEVDDVTAYRTVRAAPPPAPVRDAIKAGAFDAVVFTSSSTVRNLVGIAGKPNPSTVIACIGPATAKTAEEHGLRVDVLAPEPRAEALVDALADHGRSLALAASEAGEEVLRPSQRRPSGRKRAT